MNIYKNKKHKPVKLHLDIIKESNINLKIWNDK